ncbi:hypothetical protein SGQ44_09935 [Flavobacterium sp. Fl-77]|uniref:Uncharacterized protein n=1 Tax=Flavobacterium flavipigmentatum TaxID=2893884 RepID=A0AAJ2SBI6_9FLAO|nr:MULTISPECIES: hypothetical protein [unclassified Flavobacterium]MDX6182742.1 hypothetical protein [Flavobacterium sp. Fl-33]MDX6186079.1 hypothetical protein [Flavobacterium sp. Fl-77]UFH38229.1 hypothetical protein LNP22_16025 [Flavobacterium sp. F-70]
MKKIFFTLLFISHTIFSQQIETFNYPKDHYRVETKDFKINPTLNYQVLNEAYFPVTLEDLNLKKGKPIKNISYYYNDDNTKACSLEFTPEGKIAMTEDFYRNEKITFNYSKEIIIRKKYEIRNDKSERVFSIDSIVYDQNQNIIRKSLTNYDLKQKNYKIQIEDYEYLEKNKLVKMYRYSIVENIPYIEGYLSVYEHENNLITEKIYYFKHNNHYTKELKKDSLSIDSNFKKNVYYLNKKGEISKFDQFITDKSKEKSTSLIYDNFSRINFITTTMQFDNSNTDSFKFDINNNIIEFTYDGAIRKCKYDKNNNVISDILTDKESNENMFTAKYTYQYDINNNWTTIVFFKNGSLDTKMTRKINYY